MSNKFYFIIAIILIVVDQISKTHFALNYTLGESYQVFNWLSFTYLHNTGAAFSLGAEYEMSRYILPTISIVASVFLSVWMIKTPSSNILKLSALTLILAGAFGNFIDRALFGYVVDFIHITTSFWGYQFAIFNIADSFISVGVVLLLLSKDD